LVRLSGSAAKGAVSLPAEPFFTEPVSKLSATFSHQPNHGDIDESLSSFGRPYGPLLLGSVALGFILYGVCMAVEARHRNI